MGKKAPKSARKFASKGHLKKTIGDRKKHQQIKKKIQGRRGAHTKLSKKVVEDHDIGEDDQEVDEPTSGKAKMTVDDFLGAKFMQDESDASSGEEADSDEEMDDGEDSEDDNASFGSVDDLDDDGEAHLLELSKLAEKDPEFFKYLQENDKELLEFDPDARDDDKDMEDRMGETSAPLLTKDILQRWQKAILETRSLRALRKLLIAFRSAAHMNEDEQVLAWRIDSSEIYDKVLTTAFRYTPVVLSHHVPYKTLPSGKLKPPAQTPKFKALQKLILSYFNNAIFLLGQMTDADMLKTAISELSKTLPYVMSSRKSIKAYTKRCLDLWSSADDTVRMSAFLALRKLASSSEADADYVMKQSYMTLVKCFKATNAHTLPAITFMKNSASEIYALPGGGAYQHAFGYIRQLAIHLRNSMKVKTKESFKMVYNWQFAHSVDFWCLVLARGKGEGVLKPLVYPLIQVSLGAIRLITNSRSYPFHLHVLRSLLHLTSHTPTYISLAPILVPIITNIVTTKPKPSTLKPLDLELHIRAPQQYLKTKVYHETLIEESTFLLASWLASPPVHSNLAFPELCIPVATSLRKALKSSKAASPSVKTLLERIDESSKWIEEKRRSVAFGPGNLSEVEKWTEEMKEKVEKGKDAPLVKYVKVLKRTREKQREMMEKARKGEDEIVVDED
ncbi:Noc2-domain-containing protein [Flagelloscypha sp. PMI_526]|nr:Noc2-domain-containing protein [Flagelloscypha sp. PMI_526]